MLVHTQGTNLWAQRCARPYVAARVTYFPDKAHLAGHCLLVKDFMCLDPDQNMITKWRQNGPRGADSARALRGEVPCSELDLLGGIPWPNLVGNRTQTGKTKRQQVCQQVFARPFRVAREWGLGRGERMQGHILYFCLRVCVVVCLSMASMVAVRRDREQHRHPSREHRAEQPKALNAEQGNTIRLHSGTH